MKQAPYFFASLIIALAVIISAYNGSLSWMALTAFVVVVFPQWRGKLYRLAEKVLTKHDSCDPR